MILKNAKNEMQKLGHHIIIRLDIAQEGGCESLKHHK
jgi:hypothetical protein